MALDRAHAVYDNAPGHGVNGVWSSVGALAQELNPSQLLQNYADPYSTRILLSGKRGEAFESKRKPQRNLLP
jgi:hypothetical protein